MKYLKGNFLPLRTFRDLADLNAQARAWVLEEAGVRCHGTTRRTPLALFALEAPLLHPLPAQAPDLGSWHRVSVHRDCRSTVRSLDPPLHDWSGAGRVVGADPEPSSEEVSFILSIDTHRD